MCMYNINCLNYFYIIFNRQRREGATLKNVSELPTVVISPVHVYGLRMEYSNAAVDYDDLGVPQLLVQRNASFRLFGNGWNENTWFVLTEKLGHRGGPCEFPVGDIQEVCITIISYLTHYFTVNYKYSLFYSLCFIFVVFRSTKCVCLSSIEVEYVWFSNENLQLWKNDQDIIYLKISVKIEFKLY